MSIWHCRVGTVSNVIFCFSEIRTHSVLFEAFLRLKEKATLRKLGPWWLCSYNSFPIRFKEL